MTNSYYLALKPESIKSNSKPVIWLLIIWSLAGAGTTTFSSLVLAMEGVYTNWYYLSLNYFSRAWTWVLLTPVVFYLYRYIFYSGFRNCRKIWLILMAGITVAFVHVMAAAYLDVVLRKWLQIIEMNYWQLLVDELPLFIRLFYRSLLTFLLLIGLFSANDHFGFMVKYVAKKDVEKPVVTRKNDDRLMVKSEGKIKFLALTQIRYIESKGNYLRIQLHKEKVIIRKTLKEFHQQLPAGKFFRINRSVIVNLDYIGEMEPWFNGEYVVRMSTGTNFKTGRAYREQIRLLLKLNIPD